MTGRIPRTQIGLHLDNPSSENHPAKTPHNIGPEKFPGNLQGWLQVEAPGELFCKQMCTCPGHSGQISA
jgi:hypothetical protein